MTNALFVNKPTTLTRIAAHSCVAANKLMKDNAIFIFSRYSFINQLFTSIN